MKNFFKNLTKKQIILMSSVAAVIVIAIVISIILLTNSGCNHVYDHDCDDVCNECGATRVVTHVYDNEQDATCNKCGYTRTVEHEHTYDNNCDPSCNVCGDIRTVEHTYDDDQDIDCNICGVLREIACVHEYDNDCDDLCNICCEIRTVEHVYDSDADAECNACGFVRDVNIHEHTYDNACDSICNGCGEQRSVPGHVYDNGCDDTCNICNETRTVEGHTYDNACDTTCNVCSEVRVVPEHVYDNNDDLTCNVCGYERDPNHLEHVYDNNCDESCNGCDYIRVAPHSTKHVCSETCSLCEALIANPVPHNFNKDNVCSVCKIAKDVICDHAYDNACDEFCNKCSEYRDVTHNYQYSCSETCRDCGWVREVTHSYNDYCDSTCIVCGYTRTVEHFDEDNNAVCDYCNKPILSDEDQARVDAFIDKFNKYLENALTNNRSDLTSNIKFSNISFAGSLAGSMHNPYSSISIFDNVHHYVEENGYEYFDIYVDGGYYTLVLVNGEYKYAGSNINNSNAEPLPKVRLEDIVVNNDGTISLSNEYLSNLYTKMIYGDVTTTWIFGNQIVAYDRLLAPMIDGAKFEIRIKCDDNGNIESYNLTLKDASKTYHSINYSNTNTNVSVTMTINTTTSSKIEFDYIKGSSATAKVTVTDGSTTHTLNMSVTVEDLNGFVMSDELKSAINGGQILFDSDVAISKKYSGTYTYVGNCYYIACYDVDAKIYVVFKQNNHGKYEYINVATNPDAYNACIVTADIANKTLTLSSHNAIEQLESTLISKYAGTFTYAGSYDLGGAIIYDSELQVYVIFIETTDGYVLEDYVTELPPEAEGVVPLSKINLTTKTITD